MINEILNKEEFTKGDIVYLLSLTGEEDIAALNKKALETKETYVGRIVYYRGLIEYSNVCRKNCYYCGIRHDHKGLKRYNMTHSEVVDAALAAYQYQYGSIVIQAGERMDSEFIDQINSLLMEIKEKTEGKLGITLSVGEQTAETYKAFF
ncbi:MAG: [FeFe] hydrogenase H-cluster radical SAM maturase HydE, partial [bacterium]|nr:[FeFe] hydrogenase H-cluster radical SAM maturase HydE [bacterium]